MRFRKKPISNISLVCGEERHEWVYHLCPWDTVHSVSPLKLAPSQNGKC